MKFTALYASAVLIATAFCHIEVSYPYPFRSRFDPEIRWPNQPDWNNKDPLFADGTNFPCKLYHQNPPWRITKSVTSGQEYELSLDGTATHRGGSCQLSLSYDQGRTFRVIKSIEGGCTLTQRYNFSIPAVAAGADAALLSWTWFNREGNREMYQNCIPIRISGPGSTNPANSIAHLPLMFTCNINNGCRTVEYRRVCFPNPGPILTEGNDQNRDGSTISGERCSREESRDFEADGWGDSIQEVLKDGQEETGEAWEL